MFWIFLSILILTVGLLNIKKVNNMFNKPTVEELENYQESVFLHIDEEVSRYKKYIKTAYEEEGKPTIDEMRDMIGVLDEKIIEFKEIEKRIDEKYIKLRDYREMIGV